MFTHKSDQSRRVEQIGDSEDGQTADASPDPAAVFHLDNRKRLTLGQVELNVPLRQSLQGHVDGDEQVRTRSQIQQLSEDACVRLTWLSGRPLLSGTNSVDWTVRLLRRFMKSLPDSDT